MRLLHLFILKEINYPLLLRIWKKFKSMENHSPAAVGAGGYWNQVFWEVLCDSDSPVLPLHYLEVFKLQLVFAYLNHVMSKSPLILQHLPQTTAHNGGKKEVPGDASGCKMLDLQAWGLEVHLQSPHSETESQCTGTSAEPPHGETGTGGS